MELWAILRDDVLLGSLDVAMGCPKFNLDTNAVKVFLLATRS